MTTVSAAEFNQNPSRAKRAAKDAPVVITERSVPAFVLLSYAEFERMTSAPRDLGTWLAGEDDIEFEPAPLSIGLRTAEL